MRQLRNVEQKPVTCQLYIARSCRQSRLVCSVFSHSPSLAPSQAGATSQDQVYLRSTTLALIERANGNEILRGYVYLLELVEVVWQITFL